MFLFKKKLSFFEESINTFDWIQKRSRSLKKFSHIVFSFKKESSEKDLHGYEVVYDPAYLYGSVTIVEEYAKDNNNPKILWRLNFFNLYTAKEQKELFKIVYDFMHFEAWQNILKFNIQQSGRWDVGTESPKRNMEERNQIINVILKEKQAKSERNKGNKGKADSVFKFFLMNAVLLSNTCPDKETVEDSLSNPFDYNVLSVEDKSNLSFFTSLMSIIIIDDSDSPDINNYFLNNTSYSWNQDTLESVVQKSILGKSVDSLFDSSNSKNMFKNRTNKVYKDLNYVFKASDNVSEHRTATYNFSGETLYDQDEHKNILNFSASIYKLCFSNLRLPKYNKESTNVINELVNDQEGFERVNKTFDTFANEVNCSVKVSEDLLNEKVKNYVDVDLVGHLMQHDEDKVNEVLKYLSEKIGDNYGNANNRYGSYSVEAEEFDKTIFTINKSFSGIVMGTSSLALYFTAGFIIVMADWAVNNDNNIPFSLWVNLNSNYLPAVSS